MARARMHYFGSKKCWFCNEPEQKEKLVYNRELNAYVHENCLKSALNLLRKKIKKGTTIIKNPDSNEKIQGE